MGEETSLTGIPDQFFVSQNYPNPFNPSTKITFALPEAGHVKIEIFNILGQRIRLLVDQEYAAGIFDVLWDGTDECDHALSSGVYFCRVVSGEYVVLKKMMFMQ